MASIYDDYQFEDSVAGRVLPVSRLLAGLRHTDEETTHPTYILPEQDSTPDPVGDGAVLYSQDNGAGKTQLMVLFPTGAAIQLAIEA